MSWYHWEYYPRKKAIPVKNGIKAKSQRGDIGETWWSQQFLDALYRFDIGARLDRGRRYARQGQVMAIDVSKGLVEAKVQGSTRRPYSVEIRIAPLNDRDWRRVEKAMGARAIFLAKLLAGEMPKNIEEAFSECRLSLFPRKMSDIETECSCPDWSNPCKHIAAVYFILAERFDSDPFLLFTLRGRTKEEVLEYLSGIKTKDEIRKGDRGGCCKVLGCRSRVRFDQCLSRISREGVSDTEHARTAAYGWKL